MKNEIVGLTASDWRCYNDILLKANHKQLYTMNDMLLFNVKRRQEGVKNLKEMNT